MSDDNPAQNETSFMVRLQSAMRTVCLSLPHFVGLAHAVRLQIDRRVPSMGIFASGRLMVNPEFAASLLDRELVFVLAHELYHLALKTHERAVGTNSRLFNQAHDYIINDLLREELGGEIPADGLNWPGARHLSAERIMADLKRYGWQESQLTCWSYESMAPDACQPTDPNASSACTDVLTDELERSWFPELSRESQRTTMRDIRDRVEQTLINDLLRKGLPWRSRGMEPGQAQVLVDAIRGAYRPPWELALQRWVEAVAPSTRTFHRASRRMGDRQDVIVPGRQREGWILHIILDTSGSMAGEHAMLLGLIADFCAAAGVDQVHLMQCDTCVTRDELLSPEQLACYQLHGLGGSDLSPAMLQLADDAEVEAVLILTDGEIGYPPQPMPYEVLWVVTASNVAQNFLPAYGAVMQLPSSLHASI